MMLNAPLSVLLLALSSSLLPAQIVRITEGNRLYLAQRVSGTRAVLTPNTCYFDGKGLRCSGKGPADSTGAELNGGKSFDSIQGLKAGNQISWFLQVRKAGGASLKLLGTLQEEQAARIWIEIAKPSTANPERMALQNPKSVVDFADAGVYRIRVGAKGPQPISVQGLVLEGKAMEGAHILRTRWRPRAAHARFTASKLVGKARVWIMEMDAVPGEARFYSPMTTPFGYFGSSWTAEGKPTGMNFSMWSYGRGKKEPPLLDLSHLIAIGNPKASFGGFGHEGTGVKPRGWNPFEGWKGQRSVFALRLQPGKPYDTYYSYFFDEAGADWQLFAVGRKASKPKRARRKNGAKQETSLFVGTFVEVPGPPARQRTGHIVRKMRYRGFVLNDKRQCFALDRMKGEGKGDEICNRGRGVTKDHRFELWAGGMEQLGINPAQRLDEPMDATKLAWMQDDKLAALFTVPTQVDLLDLRREKSELVLRYRVRGLGKLQSAKVYYGPDDGQTFASRWKSSAALTTVKEGEHRIRIRLQAPTEAENMHARILLVNQHGLFWSMQTVTCPRE